MQKDSIILIGAGGHCESVIDVLEQQAQYSIGGIVDLKEKIGEKLLGYSIIGEDKDIPSLTTQYHNFHITLGFIRNPERRIRLYHTLLKLNVKLPTIISPKAYVSKHAKIGKGSVIMHFAQINAGATIGNNCIINSKALVEHDAIVKNHCHISTGSVVNGDVVIGEASFIGSNATIIQGAQIPPRTFVKAGSLFIRR